MASIAPMIRNTLPNSPAAGSLKDSMYILKVNNVSCKGKTIEEVVGMIHGEVGSHVKLLAADNKPGKHAKDYDLVRATIQAPNSGSVLSDPIEVFQKACEGETKVLRRKGYGIVKTFNSDCGNFFFNFNADTGTYHIAMYSLEEKGSVDAVTASVYDSRKEERMIKLAPVAGSKPALQRGELTFNNAGVGGIKTEVVDAQKCKAIYIVVYK